MAYVKTVKVERKDHPDGYIVINEFDKTEKDVLYKELEKKSVEEQVEEAIQEQEPEKRSGKK